MSRFIFIIVLFIATAAQAQALTPSDRERETLQLAEKLKKGGDLDRAADIYQQAAERDKNSVTALIELASLDRKRGKKHEAVAAMQEARTRQPGNTQVLMQLGYAFIADKQQEEAVNIFDTLIAMQPDNALAYNGKAVAFDSAGNHVAAQEIYEKALKLAPDSLTIQSNRALSLVLDDKTDEAIAFLENINQQGNATPTMRQNLALAYGLKGDEDKARALNLKDLKPEQAEENLRFYKHYAELKAQHQATDLAEQIEPAFSEPSRPVSIIGAKETVMPDVSPSAGKPRASKKPAKTKIVKAEPPQEKPLETPGVTITPLITDHP